MKVCISSGHGKYISGAVGPSPWGLHEHTEAVKVVNQMAVACRDLGIDVETYEDTISKSQNENLQRICDWHNAQGVHDLDLSIHFNAASVTDGERGSEVYYTSSAGQAYAKDLVTAICTASGLKNRGAKNDDTIGGLYFLSHTQAVACLVEVAFVDAKKDCEKYRAGFTDICSAMAVALSEESVPIPPGPQPGDVLFSAEGTCSWFGGPDDTGVSPAEGLAFIYNYDEAPWLFLPKQPQGTSGLARRLDPGVFFLACRWDYSKTSKLLLRDSGQMALVTAHKTGISRLAHPADWGPHEEQTGRAADLSQGLMDNLGITTDDTVSVVYPFLVE